MTYRVVWLDIIGQLSLVLSADWSLTGYFAVVILRCSRHFSNLDVADE